MDNGFELLECDNDVLSLFEPEQTFKLGNFRERVSQQFSIQLNNYSKNEGLGFISIGNRQIYSSKINWQSTPINCEILRMGAKNWQKGKIRIQVNLGRVFANYPNDKKVEIHHVYLEFYPDKPEVEEASANNNIIQPKSPLDDLRQMMNQENQQ